MGNLQSLFGQLWKEYSLSDSRYLTKDPFVLCMESITAVRLDDPGEIKWLADMAKFRSAGDLCPSSWHT